MKERLILGRVLTLLLVWVAFSVPAGTLAAEEYKELRIGANCVLSGPGAGWMKPAYQGVTMRVEEINAAGGLIIGGDKYKVKLFAEDSKMEVGAATAALEKLIYRDKVHVMWTTMGIPVLATHEKIEQLHMLNFIISWDPKVRGSKYPYTYSAGIIGRDFEEEFYGWVLENYHLRTSKAIAPKNEVGYYTERDVKEVEAIIGAKDLGSEFFEADTTDFHPLISRITAAKTEVVFTAAATPIHVANLLKQRDELGAKFLVVDQSPNAPLAMRVAPKACEHDYVFRHTDFEWSPKAKDFYDRYMKRWKEWPVESAQESYDFVGLYTQAVQKAGTMDSDAVKAVLDAPNFEYEGLMGTYKWGGKSRYGRNCNICYPVFVGVIQDGKIKVLARIPIKSK